MKWLNDSDKKLDAEFQSLVKYFLEEGAEAASVFIQSHQVFRLKHKLNKMARAGHQMLFISYEGVDYVLKRFSDTPTHSFGRRLEFFLLNLFRNPAKRSYLGATMLFEAGIPSIEPVCCLTSRSGLKRSGVVVYIASPASSTLGEWYGQNPSHALLSVVFKKLAELVRVMDRHGLRQTDFTMRNVLITLLERDVSLVLIDTDDIYKRNIEWLPKPVRLRMKLWFLRRLRPSEEVSRVFLKAYLGDEYSEKALQQWLAIRASNSNPLKKIKKIIKKKKS